MPFSTPRVDLILVRIRERLATTSLNEWERTFLTDMEVRLGQHREQTRLSGPQYRKLHALLEIQPERTHKANESQLTDRPARSQANMAGSSASSGATKSSPPYTAYKVVSQRRPRQPAAFRPRRAIRRFKRKLAMPVYLIVGIMALVGILASPNSSITPSGPQNFQPLRQDLNGNVLYVIGSSVNQRTAPGTNSRIIGSLPGGTPVRRLGSEGNWTQIASELGTGWMSSSFLASERPSSSQQPRQPLQPSSAQRGLSVSARDIRVIDGDTVAIRGERANVRLVGFDTPEVSRPSCQAEGAAGRRATARLSELLSSARSIEFERVACACPPNTQGTDRCNFGRQCGSLYADGTDVGQTLISEGLAVRYICGSTSCPPRQGNWCR